MFKYKVTHLHNGTLFTEIGDLYFISTIEDSISKESNSVHRIKNPQGDIIESGFYNAMFNSVDFPLEVYKVEEIELLNTKKLGD